MFPQIVQLLMHMWPPRHLDFKQKVPPNIKLVIKKKTLADLPFSKIKNKDKNPKFPTG